MIYFLTIKPAANKSKKSPKTGILPRVFIVLDYSSLFVRAFIKQLGKAFFSNILILSLS